MNDLNDFSPKATKIKKRSNMKREYMKPTMRVVVLQQQCQILAGSSPSANGLTGTPEGLNWDSDGLDNGDDLR